MEYSKLVTGYILWACQRVSDVSRVVFTVVQKIVEIIILQMVLSRFVSLGIFIAFRGRDRERERERERI